MQIGPLDDKDFATWTGLELLRLRKHYKWTQQGCAQFVFGVSRSTFNAWEAQTETLPRLVRLAMIGATLSGQILGAEHE